MAKNRVIGNQGKIPWHLPEDLKRFKQITMGHAIIMGRKTFESIGKPLPGRLNIVLSRTREFTTTDGKNIFTPVWENGATALDAHSLDDAIRKAGDQNEVFVIGGAEIYRLALPLADKIYMTLIDQEFEGDTFFPEVDLPIKFRIIEESPTLVSSKNQIPFRFVTYQCRHTK